MGLFIGHMGGFFILAAAVMLIGVFLCESGSVKNKGAAISYGKSCVYAAVIGMVYYFLTAFFKNVISGSTNLFDFEAVFGFLGMDKVMEQIESPSISGSLKGLMMPLYPSFTHLAGKLVKEQYLGSAVFLNFVGASAGLGCLAKMAEEKYAIRLSQLLFYVLLIPFAFVLFAPGGYGVVFGLILLAAYALYAKKSGVYIVLLIISILMNKLGVLALVPLLFTKQGFASSFKSFADKPIFKNSYFMNGVVYILMLADFLLMYLVIGGKLG